MLKPFVAVGPFRFGSTWQAIAKEHGVPDSFELDDIMHERREHRFGVVLHYRGPFGTGRYVNRLRSVLIPRGAHVVFNGIDIMHDREAVRELSAYDTPAHTENPYMIFPKLGLYLGGFGKAKIKERKLGYAVAQDALKEFEELAADPS